MAAAPERVTLLNGPVWVAAHVRDAFAAPVCDLRHPRFTAAYAGVRAAVQRVLRAPEHAVVLAAGSGSFGVELVLRACLAPGDPVLAVVSGAYGERMARMAELAGARVDRVTSELGAAPTPAEVAAALARGAYRFATIVHVEPSTGTQVRLAEVAAACRAAGAVPLVDAICSAFALELDGAGLGAVVTASQKGLSLPPGMAVAAIAPELVARARAAPEERTGFYGRLEHWLGESFVFTPPMAHVFAAEASLAHIEAETLPARAERHRRAAETVRAWARARDVAPVAADGHAAGTLTALYYPAGCDDAWLRWLRDARGVELAPATERRIAGRAFRIGHLGDLPAEHLAAGLDALDRALEER